MIQKTNLDHYLFDTLYHATALEYEGCLITADDRYHRKARALPGILHLRDWTQTDPGWAAK